MRRFLIALVLLAACQTSPPTSGDGASALATDEITVTSLDGPAAPAGPAAADTEPAAATDGTPKAAADPTAQAAPSDEAAPPADEEPKAPKTAAQVLCENSGGQWAVAGESGAFACVKPTRDGGKVCKKQGDCQGMCLARSGSCAPFMPLFGCNEVLDKDGRRVTLCIE